MKLYIDDVRSPPSASRDGSFAYWCGKDLQKAIIHYIEIITHDVTVKGWLRDISVDGITHISFDHDLGDDDIATGYDLLRRTIETYKLAGVKLPKIKTHSANPVGVERMERLLEEYNQSGK